MSATPGSIARATALYFSQALTVELTYRWALVQSVLAYGVSLAGLILFWRAAGARLGADAVYSQAALTAYFIIAYVQIMLHDNRIGYTIGTSVRMGKLSGYLLRPYPFLLSVASQAAATAVLRAVMLLPLLAVAFLASDGLREVARGFDAERLASYAGALVVSLLAGWLIRMAVGLLAFDLTQIWGPELVFIAFYTMAGGEAYPIDLLPPAVYEAVTWTPVYYMVGFPTLVLLGRIDGAAYWLGLGKGALVILGVALVVRLMWRRGVARFEAVGI